MSLPNDNVTTFLANLKYDIHNRHTVYVGSGLFRGQELIDVANALTAAPDLLEALRECITDQGAVCFVRRDMHPEYMDRRLNYISDLARAAIAKATGEQL